MSETATAAPAGGQQDGGQQAAPAGDARAWLPEAYRADPAFASFDGVDKLAKSFKDTQQFVGADKATLLKLPKDEAAPEWNDVWAKLGRPETPAGYSFEGIEDMPGLDGFRTAAHAAGLPAKQAQALAGWYAKTQGEAIEAMRVDAENTLGKEWGAAFKERTHAAKQMLDKFGGDELRDFIEKSGFGNHAGVIRMFAKVAEAVAEPGALKGGGSGAQPGAGALTPAEAQAEWTSLQRDPEFSAKYMRGDGPAVERAKRLFAQMHPT